MHRFSFSFSNYSVNWTYRPTFSAFFFFSFLFFFLLCISTYSILYTVILPAGQIPRLNLDKNVSGLAPVHFC